MNPKASWYCLRQVEISLEFGVIREHHSSMQWRDGESVLIKYWALIKYCGFISFTTGRCLRDSLSHSNFTTWLLFITSPSASPILLAFKMYVRMGQRFNKCTHVSTSSSSLNLYKSWFILWQTWQPVCTGVSSPFFVYARFLNEAPEFGFFSPKKSADWTSLCCLLTWEGWSGQLKLLQQQQSIWKPHH